MKSYHFLRVRCLITAVVLSLLLPSASRAWAAARIAINEPGWDFGAVTNLSELTRQFTIRNTGDAELVVGGVISSCEVCLRAGIDATKIPAGGSTVLRCRLDLRTLNGPVYRTVSIYSNDPQAPELVVVLTLTVVRSYEVTPRQIVLDISDGPAGASVEIVPLQELRAPLSRVACDDTNFTVAITGVESNRFVLKIKGPTSPISGYAVFGVTAQSSNSNDPPCLIRGVASKRRELEILPRRLQFLARAEPQMRIVWLRQKTANPSILIDVVLPPENYESEVEPEPGGRGYRIYITARQLGDAVGRSDEMILKLRDDHQKELAVAVPILVVPAKSGGDDESR